MLPQLQLGSDPWPKHSIHYAAGWPKNKRKKKTKKKPRKPDEKGSILYDLIYTKFKIRLSCRVGGQDGADLWGGVGGGDLGKA